MEKLEQLHNEIKELIEEHVGEKAKTFTLGKFSGLGWLEFHYICSTYDRLYPRIVLKCQSNAIHVYIMSREYGLLERYISVFGKTGLGKGCIRIKKLTPERQEALIEIISKVLEGHKDAGK
jgi:hypothetical protein